MNEDVAADLLTRFARIVAADGNRRGIQPVQLQTLRYLDRANRFSRTPKALTAWLEQTKGSVSQTLQALEDKGFILRNPDPDDQRKTLLALTAQGTALARDRSVLMAPALLQSLSSAERATFTAMVEKMLKAELTRRGGKPFGLCQDCRHFTRLDGPDASFRCALLDEPLSPDDSQMICAEQQAA